MSAEIKKPEIRNQNRDVYHNYIICVGQKIRDKMQKFLEHQGIETKVHYPIPLHLQKAAKALGYKKGDFPKAEKQSKELLTLPVHQYLKKSQINFIIKKIENFYTKKH